MAKKKDEEILEIEEGQVLSDGVVTENIGPLPEDVESENQPYEEISEGDVE